MDLPAKEDLARFMERRDDYCLSLFMPAWGDNTGLDEKRIRLKNLLSEGEGLLVRKGMKEQDARKYLSPAAKLMEDQSFLREKEKGLAVYLDKNRFYYYHVPYSLEDMVVVSNRFYVKPLLPVITNWKPYYVAAVDLKGTRLFRGSEFGLTEVEVEKPAGGLEEALKHVDPERQLQLHTGVQAEASGEGAVFHGQGVPADKVKERILEYFRMVDDGLHTVLKDKNAPLVVAAVDYLLPIYREANSYPHLLEEGISHDTEHMKESDLHARAQRIVEPALNKELEEHSEKYRDLMGTGKTSSNVEEIVATAYQSRVETLFVSIDDQVWGRFDREKASAETAEDNIEEREDLLELATVYAYLRGGRIFALRREQIPDESPVAAIYRF